MRKCKLDKKMLCDYESKDFCKKCEIRTTKNQKTLDEVNK